MTDIERLEKLLGLPYAQASLLIQDLRDEWGSDRFFQALREIAKRDGK